MPETMTTTMIYRTAATATVTVSTVLVRDGKARFYETAFIVNGKVSDGERSDKKSMAGVVHDAYCDVARGYVTGTLRAMKLANFVKEAA